MKFKTIIAITGNDGQDKTAVIQALVDLIKRKYPRARFVQPDGIQGLKFIVVVKKITIGIECLDSSDRQVMQSLKDFTAQKCDVIVYSTRARGGIVNAVESLDDKYDLIWTQNYVTNERNRKELNSLFVESILKLIVQYHPGIKT